MSNKKSDKKSNNGSGGSDSVTPVINGSDSFKPANDVSAPVNPASSGKVPSGIVPSGFVASGIFWVAIISSASLIYFAVYKEITLKIPTYVIVYSLIGGLMYLFASTAIEWSTKTKELKAVNDGGTKLKDFINKSFYDKLNDFGIQRKALRVLAAPLMAIGVYLLFDLIFVDFGTTTASSNLTENSSILEIVDWIENSGDSDKIIRMKAGISFLAGAFVKQFLDLIQALAEGIGKKK